MSVTYEDIHLTDLLNTISSALDIATEDAAKQALEVMYQNVPVSDINHKHLVETLKTEHTGNAQQTLSAGSGLNDIRAVAVEFGTIKMAAQPYFYSSIIDSLVQEAFIKSLQSELL